MKKPVPLDEGARIPDFATTDDQGNEVASSNLKGSKYLLYFYPRDNTPGCTAEACGFRDLWDGFKSKKIQIRCRETPPNLTKNSGRSSTSPSLS